MKKHVLSTWTALGVVALALPVAAMADLSSTVTLPANSALNMDTGAIVTSGGDIVFTGTSITVRGTAGVTNFGALGATAFSTLPLSTLTNILPLYLTVPISGGSLVVNDVFAVHTNGGNFAKALITALSASSITIQFTTFGAASGGGGGAGAPTVTAVQNNSSLIPSGFPNSGVAPSSLFVIKGSGLCDPTAPNPPSLQSTAAPGIPATLFGASITVTVNGVTTHPGIYYAIPTQIAAVLPAATPTGTGTLTVSYNNVASAAFSIQVVSNALGINNYNGGLGAVTDVNGVVFTFTNSAAPGQTAVVWATGLGADPADSDTVYATSPHTVNVPLTVYVGGTQADTPYQGASVYPGVNQINVKIPASAPTGCYVPLAAIVGNVVSNTVTIPIAVGGGVCSEPQYGLRGDQISTFNGQSTIKSGTVGVIQSTSPGVGGAPTVNGAAVGSFQQVTGSNFISGGGAVSVGGCFLTQSITSSGTIPTIVGLDAGTITLTGPGGSPITLSTIAGFPGLYTAALAAGAIPTSGGSFGFKGSGGSQVGPFNTTVNFPNPILSWTNQTAAATVTRGQGMQVTWTGGAPGTYVSIGGSSVSASAGVSGSYVCISPQETLQFTVPTYVLLGLPPGTGTTTVTNSTPYTTFTATGLDFGTTYGAVSYSVKSTFN